MKHKYSLLVAGFLLLLNIFAWKEVFILTDNRSLITDNCFFLFGPEGGFTEDELRIANGELRIKLTDNRLRSETAIITAASILTTTL